MQGWCSYQKASHIDEVYRFCRYFIIACFGHRPLKPSPNAKTKTAQRAPTRAKPRLSSRARGRENKQQNQYMLGASHSLCLAKPLVESPQERTPLSGSYRPILLKKSVSSLVHSHQTRKLSTSALLREIWSRLLLKKSKTSTRAACFGGRKWSAAFFNRIGQTPTFTRA